MKININAFNDLQEKLQYDFESINKSINNIKKLLAEYSDPKKLKGDEIVGWYGEVCCCLITEGELLKDDKEYDVLTPEGFKISVKTRKGNKSGWKTTSAIPKIDIDEESPTHLMFIHLSEEYNIEEIWLFEWKFLKDNKRFIEHRVRGNLRSYIFRINQTEDQKYLIYKKVHKY